MKKFVRLPAIKEATGLATSTIYEGMKAGWFPSSISIGPRAVAWDLEEITAWQTARMAERETTAA